MSRNKGCEWDSVYSSPSGQREGALASVPEEADTAAADRSCSAGAKYDLFVCVLETMHAAVA